MNREKALKIVLVLVGLLFVAGVYPLVMSIQKDWQANKEYAEPMGISRYVTQGVFLLLAARNPSLNRGVITFAAWMNIAHAAVVGYGNPLSIRTPETLSSLTVFKAGDCALARW